MDDTQFTLGSVYEEISEGLAMARTKALMGDRDEAMKLFQSASLELKRFRSLLQDYPGYAALEYAFNATWSTLKAKREDL